MKLNTFLPVFLFAILALPITAQAQGTVQGAQEGAAVGDRDAGPLGAVVGGAVGAVTGTIGGILGIDDRPRFHEYVVQQRHASYRYSGELRIGAVLPPDGPTYYDIPGEYHVQSIRLRERSRCVGRSSITTNRIDSRKLTCSVQETAPALPGGF